jgi:CRP-like cAMP-binding protein
MKRFDWEDFFAQHRIFSSLDKREIALLLRQDVSTERACHQGEVILQEGGPGDTIFLIGSGSVQVVLPRDSGREIPISTLRQGECFGEMAVLEHKERAATVRAQEDCVLLEMKGKAFTDVLQDHADIELKILAMQSERIRVLNHSLLLKVQSVDEKIDIFKTTLNAELKSVEATLKATQAIFDLGCLKTPSSEHFWCT